MTKEELRKEAEEWLSITDNHLNDERTHFLSESEYAEQAYLAGAEPREKRIAELEKENAQLKDYRLTTLAKQQTGMSKYALNLEHKLSWYDDQLTNAKEIIREFVEWATWQGSNCPNFKSIQDKAEQFLNEVEK